LNSIMSQMQISILIPEHPPLSAVDWQVPLKIFFVSNPARNYSQIEKISLFHENFTTIFI